MSPNGFDDLIQSQLTRRQADQLLRARVVMESVDSTHVRIGGRTYVNFASNDYLGLSHHPAIVQALQDVVGDAGAGAGAAGLITGFTRVHEQAERDLAGWKGTGGCVLMPSGYQANHAAIQTIAGLAAAAGRRVRFLIDKLAHASLVDAVRAVGERGFRVFPHNHIEKLRRLLKDAPADELQVVVTESIFSMDGDSADLPAIAGLKREREFVLLVDEAHGSGVYGEAGRGFAAEAGVNDSIDVTVVTLSKALGVQGGAVCGSERFCDAVVNFGRAYIYSTSVSPAIAAAASAAVGVLRAEPQRRERVREMALRVRREAKRIGLSLPEGDSPIVPVIVGSEARAMEAANLLCERGILTIAVRPPTVPRGQSRLRITVSSEHTAAEIDQLIEALGAIV